MRATASVAVGGQVLTLQGLGGVYDEIFLPLHGAHQAQNAAVALAAVEAFLGAGRRAAARRRDGAGGLRRGRARRAGWSGCARAPTVLLDAAHNPHGMAAHRRRAAARRSPSAGWSPSSPCSADKDVAGHARAARAGRRRDRGHPEQLAAGRCRRDELAALAVEVFGEDRVTVEPRLPDAIEAAVRAGRGRRRRRAGGVGVLVTGSVVTVADARRLLKR